MNLISLDYENIKDKNLVEEFLSQTSSRKKYILGINRFTKAVQKYIKVDGIIDDFSRVQSSKKKSVLSIDEVSSNSLILSTASGSPLEVKLELDRRGFDNINYLAFCKYSNLELKQPPFISDFISDFKENKDRYKEVYKLLADEKSKDVFKKVINFKISYDLDFMEGFTNNHDEQYFDKEIIPNIENIVFIDGGTYVGDTLPNIIKNFSDFKKIYAIEPNELHINIAKKDFSSYENIEFINCGLGEKKKRAKDKLKLTQNNCHHDYQALDIDSIDNLINEKVDFIKLDIEGAEQDALLGAKNTIEKYNPILAICIYHKAEDWYKVPKIVLNINKNYKIYLRHYMEGIYETVMYFIPMLKS